MIQLFFRLLKKYRLVLVLVAIGGIAGQAQADCKFGSTPAFYFRIPTPTISVPASATLGAVFYEKSFVFTLPFASRPDIVACGGPTSTSNYFTVSCTGPNQSCDTGTPNGPTGVTYRILIDSVPGAVFIPSNFNTSATINFPDNVTQKQDVPVSMRLQLIYSGPGRPQGPIVPIPGGTADAYNWSVWGRSTSGYGYFKGYMQLTPTTCLVTATNPIPLDTANTSELQTVGKTARAKPFSIVLSNCQDSTTNTATNNTRVRTYFDGPSIDPVSGRLNVDANGAQNVQLQVLNADGSVINLAGDPGRQNSAIGQIMGGNATLRYLVQYYATGQVTPGKVISRVNYTMDYP